MTVERGEIYYITPSIAATGSEQRAGRPAIIVSNEMCNRNLNVFEVVYLTTQPKKDMPTHVQIRSTGMTSTALCEQISSVNESRFGSFVGKCTDAEMQMIDLALAISIGISASCTEVRDPVRGVLSGEKKETPAADYAPLHSKELIEVQTERDVYKRLYEQMLERMVK